MLMTLAVVMPQTDSKSNSDVNAKCAIMNFKNTLWWTFMWSSVAWIWHS